MPLTPEQFQDRMKKAGPRTLKAIEKKFIKMGLRMETSAKINATFYPRVVTGRLRSSINSKVITSGGSPRLLLRAGGTNQVNYARAIEFGTDRIKPRLFMGTAFNDILKRADKNIKDAVKVSLVEASAF